MKGVRARGFTVVELLVVMAIIGLLSSIILATLNTSRQKARDNSRQTSLRQVQIALDLYYNAYGTYPASMSALVPGFIAALPKDPLNGTDYGYTVTPGCVPSDPAQPCTTDWLGATMERTGQVGLLATPADDDTSHALSNGTNCADNAGAANEAVYCAKSSSVPGT